MARNQVVVLSCDLCESEEDVRTLSIAIDNKAPRDLELCAGCKAEYIDPIVEVSRRGRRQERTA